jgi:hypothetical protein
MQGVWRLAGVVCVSLSLLAGGARPALAKGGSKSTNVVVLTNDQIAADAMLALADMPTGYAADPTDQAQGSQPNGATGVCNGPNTAARAQAQGVVGMGFAEFAQNATTGPFLSEGVYSFGSTKQAEALLTATTAQTACNTWSGSSDGVAINYTVAPIAYAKVGDDTVAYRVTSAGASSPGIAGSADDILVRIKNNAILLSYGGLGGSDTSLEQQYVGKAITKLGVALAIAKKSSTKPKKKS